MDTASHQWSTSLLQSNEVFDYAGICICPCMYFDKVYKDIALNNVPRQARHDAIATLTTWILSLFVDLPIIFCLPTLRERTIHFFNGHDLHELDPDEEEWDPYSSTFDWWPLSWFSFYTSAACEYLCSCICCGPQVHGARFPLCFTCTMALIYPCCTCPLSFLIRETVKRKYKIDEPCAETCLKSTCCFPCSVKQVSETVESKSKFVTATPHITTSMFL